MAAVWVLDTGILVESALVRLARNERAHGQIAGRLRFLTSQDRVDVFEQRIQERHVVTLDIAWSEAGWTTHGLVATRGASSRHFSQVISEVVHELKVETRALPVRTAADPGDGKTEKDFGPVDAAFLRLARRLRAEGQHPCLLTVDSQLAGLCDRNGLESEHAEAFVSPRR